MIWQRTKRFARATLIVLLCASLLYLALLVATRFVRPVSTIMLARWVLNKPVDRRWVAIEQIPPALIQAVIASEDAKFCSHRGVDWGELRAQVRARGGPSRGASTLTMQSVKNLFLWPQQSYLRKGLEIPMALAADFVWPKRRTMEIYLNIAEWGEGVFGAQAASHKYFRKPVYKLNAREASLLATALPNPLARNPLRPGRRHIVLANINQRRAARAAPLAACLSPSK